MDLTKLIKDRIRFHLDEANIALKHIDDNQILFLRYEKYHRPILIELMYLAGELEINLDEFKNGKSCTNLER